ncbi:MAG: hypothetical protein F6K23_22310 [Okeania sp. SIO2C9]|uniref:hypothetical protein n=1 Tax=Okeania sp. SIO2C9 TaxID=2607791 RepID=UPI0013C0DD52|nr:hypothetical protein [Okeania sp. SIO2C9]NEQ75540.1 hypothetical protein [Okeania sp. SIO2C9]
MLTGAQRAEIEKARAEKVEQARINAVSQLLATGMDVAQVAQILSFTVEEVISCPLVSFV